MKQNLLLNLKVFLIACIAMLIGGSSAMAQETETIIFKDLGYENGGSVTNVVAKNVTLTFDQGSHKSNGPKYYDTGTGVRTYEGNTMSVSSETLDIEKIAITFSGSEYAKLTADGFSISGTTGTWTGEKTKSVTFTANGTSRIQKVEITFAPAAGALAAPTITATTGALFDDSQNVTITSEEGTTIWYTVDGTEPAVDNGTHTESNTVTFSIDKTTTVKAIATDGTKVSSVATATYTKTEWLNGLSALVAQIKEDNSSSSKDYYVNLTEAVVTGVNGSNVYIEEGEAGILLYKSGHGLTVGQKYSGSSAITAQMYRGLPEITSFDFTLAGEVAELPLVTVTLEQLETEFDKYNSRRIQVVDATVTAALESRNGTIMQGEKSLNVYANSTAIVMEKDKVVDIIGWVNLDYQDSKQLQVWSQDDITVKGSLAVFYFETDAVSVRIDATDVEEPLLTNSYNEAPVFSSSNTEVATVDATTGEVTIVAEGATTITAKLEGAQKEASYTLTVTPMPVMVAGNYYLVLSADELVDGGTYLITGKAGTEGETIAIMSSTQNKNNRSKTSGETESNQSVITKTADDACVFVLRKGTKEGTWAFYDQEATGYLYAASSGSNHLKTQAELDDNGSATIEVSNDGTATIKFQGANTRNWLRYNPGNANNPAIFSCYGATSTQQDVQLFKLYTGTTGIDSVESTETGANAAIYDLSGRRVAKAGKGIYIVNGKIVAY